MSDAETRKFGCVNLILAAERQDEKTIIFKFFHLTTHLIKK